MASYITQTFLPVEAHIKEHPAWFHRFDVFWTPTVLILAPEGVERYRIEGYLPRDEFRAQLELGFARVALVKKKWADAEKLYNDILRQYPETAAAPEALYWAGVSRYSASHDASSLVETAKSFKHAYQQSIWAKKASVWGG